MAQISQIDFCQFKEENKDFCFRKNRELTWREVERIENRDETGQIGSTLKCFHSLCVPVAATLCIPPTYMLCCCVSYFLCRSFIGSTDQQN